MPQTVIGSKVIVARVPNLEWYAKIPAIKPYKPDFNAAMDNIITEINNALLLVSQFGKNPDNNPAIFHSIKIVRAEFAPTIVRIRWRAFAPSLARRLARFDERFRTLKPMTNYD